MPRTRPVGRFLIPLFAFACGIFIAPQLHPLTGHPAATAASSSRERDGGAQETKHSRSPRPASERVDEVLAALLSTPSEDLLGVASGIGRLTRLPDTELSKGYQSLENRPRRKDYVGSLVAAYLWSRADGGKSGLPLPAGWDLEKFPGLMGPVDPEGIRAKLLAGEGVTFEERKRFFTEELRKDPIGSFGLWLKGFSGENQLDEMPWFRSLMADPGSRGRALRCLLEAGLPQGDFVSVIDRISAEWQMSDPQGYEKWLSLPELAPYRESLMQLYAAHRCESDPENAWHLSALLPEKTRLAVQLRGSRNLAETNPQLGIRHLSEISEPGARLPLIRAFGENLAIYHYDEWKQWRDGLPAEEQNEVNESAFETWVATDVRAALAWLQSRPDGPDKSAMVSETASRFARQEPDAVAQWIRLLPDRNARLGAAIAGIRAMPQDAYDDIRKLLDAAR